MRIGWTKNWWITESWRRVGGTFIWHNWQKRWKCYERRNKELYRAAAERRSIRVAIPNPGFKITPSDNAMAIPPSTICKILVPLGDSISSVFKFIHMQNYCDLLMFDILIAIWATVLYRAWLITKSCHYCMCDML